MNTKHTRYILLAALLFFTVLTVLLVIESEPVQAFNYALYAEVAKLHAPVWTTASIWLGELTRWYVYFAIIVVLLYFPRTRLNFGLPLVVALPVSSVTGPILLKEIFAIERPDINQLVAEAGFGYPSGHSMNAMVFFGMCTVLVLRHSTSKPLKIGFTAFAFTTILAVGLSRIYLGVHTATDVIGGFLAGTVVICAVLLAEPWLQNKFTARLAGNKPSE
ncbi:MAG: phosphatase PAP2 family protein [Defluviitaleaceae bacterium]|nr:phosphatase PAP2 family protein [Defluviitaleaceae bacterium]